MRVALVTYDDEPPQGGQGVYVRGLRGALAGRGVDVVTLAGRGAHDVGAPRRTGRAPLDLSLHLARHRALITATGADVVHAQGGPGGVLLPWRCPLPLVFTAHHTYRQAHPLRSPRRWLSPLEARSYRQAARVLCVSPDTAAAVRSLGVAADRIEVVAPGIDVARMDTDAAGVARERGRLLFVGRLTPEKEPVAAVTVMAALTRAVPGVRASVIGRGPLEATVRAAAAAAPPGAVEVLGAVDDATLARAYARASILLVPSRYEGLGLVALEAMAMGVAVVGSDVSGLRDAVAGEGVLVPGGRGDALEVAVRGLLADEAQRSALAGRGRERVRRDHRWDVVAGRVEAVYHEVLGG